MKRKFNELEVIQEENNSESELEELCIQIMKASAPPPYRTNNSKGKIRNIVQEYLDKKKLEIEDKHKQEVKDLKISKRVILNTHDNMVKSLSKVLEKTSEKDIEEWKNFFKKDRKVNMICDYLPKYVKCKGRCDKKVCKEINEGIEYLESNRSTGNTNIENSEIHRGLLYITKVILKKHSNRCLDDNCKIPFCVEIQNSKFCKSCFKYHDKKN